MQASDVFAIDGDYLSIKRAADGRHSPRKTCLKLCTVHRSKDSANCVMEGNAIFLRNVLSQPRQLCLNPYFNHLPVIGTTHNRTYGQH